MKRERSPLVVALLGLALLGSPATATTDGACARGEELLLRGDLAAAEPAFRECLFLSRRAKDVDGEATSLLGLGRIAQGYGESELAAPHFELASRLAGRVSSGSLRAKILYRRSEAAYWLGSLNLAEDLAIQAVCEDVTPLERRLLALHHARLLENRSRSLDGSRADQVGALMLLDDAFALPPEGAETTAQALEIFARAALEAKDPGRIRASVLACQAFLRDRPDAPMIARSRVSLWLVWLTMGETPKSASRSDPVSAEGAADSDDHVLAACDGAAIVEEQVRMLRPGQESRAAFLNSRGAAIVFYASALLTHGQVAEGFATLEKYRGRLLAESIANPPGDGDRDRARDREYAELELRLADATPVDRPGILARLWEIQGTVGRRLSSRHPRAWSVTEAAAALPEGTVFLYFNVPNVLVLSGGPNPSVESFVIKSTREGIFDRFSALAKLALRKDGDQAALLAKGRALFEILLGPASSRLATARRLVVCSDNLPLLSLLCRKDGGTFLGLELPITYAASFGTYQAIAERRGDGAVCQGPVLVAIADPELPAAAGPLPRLPGARAEAQRIAALLPSSRVLVDHEASEESLRRLAGTARYLHLAVHGLANSMLPLSDTLVLASSSGPTGEDGLLRSWELSEVPIRADLVTLSACDSGRGLHSTSEGRFSVGRACLAAGARNVVSSLWEVLDDSQVVVELYRGVANGKPADEALWEGMRYVAARPETSHPYYWAGWHLYGDGGHPAVEKRTTP